jgi:hypothetical protein
MSDPPLPAHQHHRRALLGSARTRRHGDPVNRRHVDLDLLDRNVSPGLQLSSLRQRACTLTDFSCRSIASSRCRSSSLLSGLGMSSGSINTTPTPPKRKSRRSFRSRSFSEPLSQRSSPCTSSTCECTFSSFEYGAHFVRAQEARRLLTLFCFPRSGERASSTPKCCATCLKPRRVPNSRLPNLVHLLEPATNSSTAVAAAQLWVGDGLSLKRRGTRRGDRISRSATVTVTVIIISERETLLRATSPRLRTLGTRVRRR